MISEHSPEFLLFFFQAEDGIRDTSVTGVQTCALPIYFAAQCLRIAVGLTMRDQHLAVGGAILQHGDERAEIGRASCRERVESWVGEVGWKKKRGRVVGRWRS